MCSVIRARRPAFPPAALAWRLLPATLSDTPRAVRCLPSAATVALCGMIHKVLRLFGAKSVNCAQNRADCVCRASLMCWAKSEEREEDGRSRLSPDLQKEIL